MTLRSGTEHNITTENTENTKMSETQIQTFRCSLKFDSQNEVDINTFFKLFEVQCVENNITGDEEKRKALRSSLEGPALVHYVNFYLQIEDYETIKEELISFYSTAENKSLNKFTEMTLGHVRDIDQYYRTKLSLGKQLCLPQELILEGLTSGLPKQLRTIICVHEGIQSYSDWIRIARKLCCSEEFSPRVPPQQYQRPPWSGNSPSRATWRMPQHRFPMSRMSSQPGPRFTPSHPGNPSYSTPSRHHVPRPQHLQLSEQSNNYTRRNNYRTEAPQYPDPDLIEPPSSEY